MKVSLVAIFLPPPHLARAGAQPERLSKEISDTVVGAEVQSVLKHAEACGLFAAGGCISVTIQRASERPSQGPMQ